MWHPINWLLSRWGRGSEPFYPHWKPCVHIQDALEWWPDQIGANGLLSPPTPAQWQRVWEGSKKAPPLGSSLTYSRVGVNRTKGIEAARRYLGEKPIGYPSENLAAQGIAKIPAAAASGPSSEGLQTEPPCPTCGWKPWMGCPHPEHASSPPPTISDLAHTYGLTVLDGASSATVAQPSPKASSTSSSAKKKAATKRLRSSAGKRKGCGSGRSRK